LNLPIGGHLAVEIERRRPHSAIQATCAKLSEAAEEIFMLVNHGGHVISIAEEMAYPACASPTLAEELHCLTVARGVSIVGAGINPGFVFDVLVMTLRSC